MKWHLFVHIKKKEKSAAEQYGDRWFLEKCNKKICCSHCIATHFNLLLKSSLILSGCVKIDGYDNKYKINC